MKNFLENLGIDIALMITGFFGSVFMVSKTAAQNIKTSLVGIVSGTLAANYCTPVVIEIFHFEGKSQFGIAFILGYLGVKGVERFIIRFINKKIEE